MANVAQFPERFISKYDSVPAMMDASWFDVLHSASSNLLRNNATELEMRSFIRMVMQECESVLDQIDKQSAEARKERLEREGTSVVHSYSPIDVGHTLDSDD